MATTATSAKAKQPLVEKNGEGRHRYVPASQYCESSTRNDFDEASKGVWKYVKQLRGDHAECQKDDSDETKKTHCCVYADEKGTCYELLQLASHDSSRNTAEALDHFRVAHPGSGLGGQCEKRKLEESIRVHLSKRQAKERETASDPTSENDQVVATRVRDTVREKKQCFVGEIKELCLARKDKERLSWHEYFASMSILASARSPCERLHVGCVIVREHRMLSMGFNGFFSGAPHKSIMKDGHEQATVHAEQNAISHAARVGISLRDSCAYITHFPCINCYKSLVAAGISHVYYIDDYRNDQVVYELAKVSGVTVDKVIGLSS